MDNIQRLMQQQLPDLVSEGCLTGWQRYAGWHIAHCRTATFGGHVERCPSGEAGHDHRLQYNSCRHRSCPQCSALSRARWLENYQQHLLPCAHRQVVFTVPHDLNPLWLRNTRWFARQLFDCAAHALKSVTRDGKNLGAEAGFTLALHTWGRDQSLHPHLHALVSEGGLDNAAHWTEPKHGTYLPAEVLMRVFRGVLTARLRCALTARQLDLPHGTGIYHWRRVLSANYQKRWNVRVEKRYAQGKGLAKYLARYIRGGPVRASQVRRTADGGVTMRYKSHRSGGRETRRFSGRGFVRQLLMHSPPTGLHSVRHYGLYAGCNRHKLAAVRLQTVPKIPEVAQTMAQPPEARPCCRICGEALVTVVFAAERRRI